MLLLKVLVTGVAGQLGHDVVKELSRRNHVVIGTDLKDSISSVSNIQYVKLDITDKYAVENVLMYYHPNAVIHCAAWTAVDAAEDPKNIEIVCNVNVNGTRNIAEACKAVDAKMMYMSTDYVFNGNGTRPWLPDNKDYSPLNVYGKTKLQGEMFVSSILKKYFIIRIAWVFGINGNNFVKTMLNIGKTHDSVRVVNDQIGTPTYTVDLSILLADMIETDKYGYYHATNSELNYENTNDYHFLASGAKAGYISWYDLTREIYRQVGLKTKVIPVSTEEYGLRKANRPQNSRLDKSKLTEYGFKQLPSWADALNRFLLDLENNNRGA